MRFYKIREEIWRSGVLVVLPLQLELGLERIAMDILGPSRHQR